VSSRTSRTAAPRSTHWPAVTSKEAHLPPKSVRAGERLQKILSAAGVASRRKAEDLIREGRVSVNGAVVRELGAKADPQTDHIRVDGRRLRFPERIYLLLNKPRGVVSTVSDPQHRVTVTELVPRAHRVYPVGRLDYQTEGLILLTNDGEFARALMRAGGVPKVYHVKVKGTVADDVIGRLRAGIRLPGGDRVAAESIRRLRGGANSWYEVTLKQGRNHQIRRMLEAVGHPVSKLRRVAIGFLNDAGLPVGQHRALTAGEVARLMGKR
jgi:23S rRNA pseudouridine2605 synthase